MQSSGSPWRFGALLACMLIALMFLQRAEPKGDILEYSLAAVTWSSHASPDIRLADIERAGRLFPWLADGYQLLAGDMRAGREKVYPAFARGADGKVYPIHFFAYPAAAALPFKLFEVAGADPLKGFMVVNAAALLVLGFALRRLLGSDKKALFGVGLFMLSGGGLYWTWTSPECVTAAALLAGLAYYATGAPVRGSVLAAIGGLQNPTLVFFLAFAPLLDLVIGYDRAAGTRANLLRVLAPRKLAGLATGLAIFSLAPLFNLWQYGVPNLIATRFSDPGLIGPTRLHSFFLDLNQGMLVGLPGLAVMLALWGWRCNPYGWRREAAITAVAALFVVALALPALAVLNWNSGAAGFMRYAFWSAMPLLFVLLLRLRHSARWPVAALAALVLVQGGAMLHARSYGYVEFSPLAKLVMQYAPHLYHPEPELFSERMGGHDSHIAPGQVIAREIDGRRVTTLYHAGSFGGDQQLCGTDGRLVPGNAVHGVDGGWRYVDGQLRCIAAGKPQRSYQFTDMSGRGPLRLVFGWSAPEAVPPALGRSGAWSVGSRSQAAIRLHGMRPSTVLIRGQYFAGNTRTRVIVNGKDLGWHDLSGVGRIALPARVGPDLDIELEHEAPRSPGPHDLRPLALYLTEITLQ